MSRPDALGKEWRWREVSAPAGVEPGTRSYQCETEGGGHLTCFVSPPHASAGWHLSLSHRSNLVDPWRKNHIADRLPTWDEVVAARYRFAPADAVMALLLPPLEEYVNLMPTCFHLHEVADAATPAVKR